MASMAEAQMRPLIIGFMTSYLSFMESVLVKIRLRCQVSFAYCNAHLSELSNDIAILLHYMAPMAKLLSTTVTTTALVRRGRLVAG